jgi:hypothetical protein
VKLTRPCAIQLFKSLWVTILRADAKGKFDGGNYERSFSFFFFEKGKVKI